MAKGKKKIILELIRVPVALSFMAPEKYFYVENRDFQCIERILCQILRLMERRLYPLQVEFLENRIHNQIFGRAFFQTLVLVETKSSMRKLISLSLNPKIR